MLKMYHEHIHSGNSVELWEENWKNDRFDRALQYCTVDPLCPLFEEFAKPGSRMLEGGCGLGHYVAFYQAMGVDVVGLDFAQDALETLNQRVPGLKLCAGDVSAIPFADESFDVYYSGGVVEHFENGATSSLREAHRILRKEGILLISVPYFSPLRKLLAPFKREFWKKVESSGLDVQTESVSNLKFFQYAYTLDEFSGMLQDSGFKVKKKQGYSVIWGLYELPFIGNKDEIVDVSRESADSHSNNEVHMPSFDNAKTSLPKRLLVNEDATIPVLGLGVKFMRWAASNMMMYVCVKD